MRKKNLKIIFEGDDPLMKIETPSEIEYKKLDRILYFLGGFICGSLSISLIIILLVIL